MVEILLTHEVENISGTDKHCNRKFASEVVTGIMTTENFCSENWRNELTFINYEYAYEWNDESFYLVELFGNCDWISRCRQF